LPSWTSQWSVEGRITKPVVRAFSKRSIEMRLTRTQYRNKKDNPNLSGDVKLKFNASKVLELFYIINFSIYLVVSSPKSGLFLNT